MPLIDPVYQAHQCKRRMRPNAHLFIRADWRRFVRPKDREDHLFAQYERKYSADQARVPAGSREGGQWTDGEGGSGPSQRDSSADSPEDSSEKIRVAGSVIPICIVETRVLYGDGTHKVTYICVDGSTVTRGGPGHRFPGIIRQPK